MANSESEGTARFDVQATIGLVTAVLKDADAAARSYRETDANWQQSFFSITLPVYVAAFLIGGPIAVVTGGSFLNAGFSLGFFLFSLLWALAWTFVIAFIFDFVAGMLDTERNFDRFYAVVALAIIPAAIGNAVGSLPFLGWILTLALSIYSLILAYRFIPIFLDLAEASRVKHFAISIVVALVINVVVNMTFGAMLLPSVMQLDAPSGIFGGVTRQAELADAAAQDVYEPPSTGKLTEDQVQFYADTLKKTRALRERLGKKFKFDEEKGDPSISDIFGGVGDVLRMSTAEMEVVKSASGNWAEHSWVRSQIEIARIQQDLNDKTQHNYGLFLKYQDVIEENE